MSVQVSYKKQATMGILGLLILLLVVEVMANVWWITQINCEFEENEIFMNMNDEEKRQLCVDLYDVKILGDELIFKLKILLIGFPLIANWMIHTI